jgi:SAM-dependent methyltransferase
LSEQAKTAYNSDFFDALLQFTKESAEIVVPMVYDLVRPASVLDVGCGAGTWLAQWRNAGVPDVLGIDGDYVDRTKLQIPSDAFKPVNLQQSFSLGRTFDLVQTLEVAEHLDEANADAFVESLARHGDTILFSAAIPKQGGTHHVNEQWQSYWAEKFAKAGYTCYDILRPRIWADRRILWFYRQNMLLFTRGRSFEGFDSVETPMDLVHPEMWDAGRIARNAPEAFAKVVRSKLGSRS